MKPKLRTFLLALVAVVTLTGFALLLFTVGKPAPLPPPPNPNGYDDIMKACSLLSGVSGDLYLIEKEQLPSLIATNAEALQLLRVGLSRTCAVPLLAALKITNDLSELSTTKHLAALLAAEGRLAELDNRPADAARSYIDAVRLGNETSRGGFLIHRLSGSACEAIGYSALTKLASQLSCEQTRPLITELEKTDINGVSWDEVRRAENFFYRHELRQTFNPIRHVVGWWENRQSLKEWEAKDNLMVARRRLLTTELALRCYQAEQSRAPERLDQLVPKYLQRIPLDPFATRPLIYRAQGTNWLFYSVGPDGADDGGKPIVRTFPRMNATGDLFFDSPR